MRKLSQKIVALFVSVVMVPNILNLCQKRLIIATFPINLK